MTTIAYNYKANQIAMDGHIFTGPTRLHDKYDKYFIHDGRYYFVAGCVADIELFKQHIGKTQPPEHPIELDCLMVDLDTSTVYDCGVDSKDGWWELELKYDYAIGSGRDFALAALKLGKAAASAVDLASQLDSRTGPTYKIFDVEVGRFL